MAIKTFAAITIGSTKTELKIFEFSTRRAMKEIDSVSTRLPLGVDAYSMGRISSENIEELCSVLLDFRRIMDGYRVDACKVCATSPFRESRNRVILKDYVEKQTGFKIEVLSNSEQRFVDYKSIASVTSEFETIIQNPAAIVDIGGSSTQISLFDKDKLITTQNMKIGSLTTRERLAPLEKNRVHFAGMIEELLNHELAGFAKLYQKDRQIKNLILVGGNISELMKSFAKEDRRITSVTREQFEEVYSGILHMNPGEIASGFGIAAGQSPLVLPSMIFCHCMMENFGSEILWLPGISISDGLAYDYGVKNHLISSCHSFEEDIIAAARSIAKRYKCSQAHIRNLEETGLLVFDKTKKVHGMGKRERLLLQIAIIVHNCGKFISLEDVSECAFNIIMATEIIGLSHVEREQIAYTVKYNTSTFVYYDELNVRTGMNQEEYLVVAKLTAILRLVNAMDRTHKQKCRNVTAALQGNELKLSVASQEDLSLELGTFREKAEFFEEVFNIHPVMKQKKQL